MKTKRNIQHLILMICQAALLGACGLSQKALENRGAQDTAVSKSGTPTTSGDPSSNPSPVDLDLGLILLLHFEEDSGTAVDSAGDNDGIISGSVNVVGKKGEALLFDNYLDKITVPFSSFYNFTRMSVSTWVHWNGVTGYDQRIFQRSTNASGTNSGYNMRLDNAGRVIIDLTINGAVVTFNTSVEVSAGTWTHLAYTYDGNRINFYKNGQFSGSLVAKGNLGGYPYNNSIAIGNAAESIKPFNGGIDEFFLYNRPLNDSEISALYNLEK